MSQVLILEGMSCQHCVSAIEKAIREVPGVTGVEVSLERAQAHVEGTGDVADMVVAIKEEGYKAIPA
jgi:copper chaperone